MAAENTSNDLQITSNDTEEARDRNETNVNEPSADSDKGEAKETQQEVSEQGTEVSKEVEKSVCSTSEQSGLSLDDVTDDPKKESAVISDVAVENNALKDTNSKPQAETDPEKHSVVDKGALVSPIKNKLRRRLRRGASKGVPYWVRKRGTLNLPDGIILVRDGRYTGYHCTFCNCVLKSTATVDAHVSGKWHLRTIQIKVIKVKPAMKISDRNRTFPMFAANSQKKKERTATPQKKNDGISNASQKSSPKPIVPLKSSLEEYLSTTKNPIVGLSYIIETQRPNKRPTFQCNLCEVSCDSDDIKEHINGIKHCLMYLKFVKPAQLAELLAKQLSKVEKNKEIAKLSVALEKENGRGEIIVKSLQTKTFTAGNQPGNKPINKPQAVGNKSTTAQTGRNRFFNRNRRGRNRPNNGPQAVGNRFPGGTSNLNQQNRNSQGKRWNPPKGVPQKRRSEEMVINPATKRRLVERNFQARMQFGAARMQNNTFSGRWDPGNGPMNMACYEGNTSFYPNMYSDPYSEGRPFNRQPLNEPFQRMNMVNRTQYVNRQPYWDDHRDKFAPGRSQNYNRAVPPGPQAVEVAALKRLVDFNVNSEDDAGVVINAINSLTDSFMNYKLRNFSRPVQELLHRSLKSNDLQSLLALPGKKNERAMDRYGERSNSQTQRDWGINQIEKPQSWLF